MALIVRGLLQGVFQVRGRESVTFGARGNGRAFVGGFGEIYKFLYHCDDGSKTD